MVALLPVNAKPNEDFLKFLGSQNGTKGSLNLEMLLKLEEELPGIFLKTMVSFDSVKMKRGSLDAKGRPIKISWENAIKKNFLITKYEGVSEENMDIAAFLQSRGHSQDIFDEICKVRAEAKEKNTPEHILGKPIKETTILDDISNIAEATNEALNDSQRAIKTAYESMFTYEWLNKKLPENAIAGGDTHSCANIISNFFGKYVALATMLADDVQNLVVRNKKGEIVAKGAMYVNKKESYGLINTFGIADQYVPREKAQIEADEPDEQAREAIFQKLQSGIRAFIEEYNLQNPDNPLKQVNVGTGYNVLMRQLKRYEKAKERLYSPEHYKFYDANYDYESKRQNDQYIIYRRTDKGDGEER